MKPKAYPILKHDLRNQHECFVRDAIARSLLTLPFANEKSRISPTSAFYKQLLECATTGELPPSHVLSHLVAKIMADAAIHKAVGNHLKAEIEETWCAGLQLHFTWGQALVTP